MVWLDFHASVIQWQNAHCYLGKLVKILPTLIRSWKTYSDSRKGHKFLEGDQAKIFYTGFFCIVFKTAQSFMQVLQYTTAVI